LACSPYKFFAPHSGTIYGKREHLDRLKPYKVRPAGEDTAGRWETGTKNHEIMAAITAAIDYWPKSATVMPGLPLRLVAKR
jgi:selenocysteine lyase/cysteine desulfurase